MSKQLSQDYPFALSVLDDMSFDRLPAQFMREVLSLIGLPGTLDENSRKAEASEKLSTLNNRYRQRINEYISHPNFSNISLDAKEFVRKCFHHLQQKKSMQPFPRETYGDPLNKPAFYYSTPSVASQVQSLGFFERDQRERERINNPYTPSYPYSSMMGGHAGYGNQKQPNFNPLMGSMMGISGMEMPNTQLTSAMLPQFNSIEEIKEFQLKLYQLYQNAFPQMFCTFNNYTNYFPQSKIQRDKFTAMFRPPPGIKQKNGYEDHMAEENFNEQPRRRTTLNSSNPSQFYYPNQPDNQVKSSYNRSVEKPQVLAPQNNNQRFPPVVNFSQNSPYNWSDNLSGGYNPKVSKKYSEIEEKIPINYPRTGEEKQAQKFSQPCRYVEGNQAAVPEKRRVNQQNQQQDKEDEPEPDPLNIVRQEHKSEEDEINLANNSSKSPPINQPPLKSLIMDNPFVKASMQRKRMPQNLAAMKLEDKPVSEPKSAKNIEIMDDEQAPCDQRFSKCLCKGRKNAQSRICSLCGNNYHFVCLKLEPVSETNDFFCHVCSLATLDPLHEVRNVIISQYIEKIAKDKHFEIQLPMRAIRERWDTKDANYDIQIRCGKLEEKEIVDNQWPDNAVVKVYFTRVGEFKALSYNSSFKRRKDNAISIGNILSKYLNIDNVKLQIDITPLKQEEKKDKRLKNKFSFVVGVFLVKKHKIEELFEKQVDKSKNKQRGQKYIQQLIISNSEDVCIQQVKVNLYDPYTKEPVETPVRGSQCRHGQCFDLKYYLSFMSMSKNKTWKCPICNHICRKFIVDRQLKSIIETLKAKGGQLPKEIIFKYKNGTLEYKSVVQIQPESRQGQKSPDRSQRQDANPNSTGNPLNLASSFRSYPSDPERNASSSYENRNQSKELIRPVLYRPYSKYSEQKKPEMENKSANNQSK